MKAIVAVEHAILIAIWNMITTDSTYLDPGADYFIQRNPGTARQRAINQLNRIGYNVTLSPYSQPCLRNRRVRDCPVNGVTGVFISAVFGGWHAVGEGAGEGVQGWLPPHSPSCLTGALGV